MEMKRIRREMEKPEVLTTGNKIGLVFMMLTAPALFIHSSLSFLVFIIGMYLMHRREK